MTFNQSEFKVASKQSKLYYLTVIGAFLLSFRYFSSEKPLHLIVAIVFALAGFSSLLKHKFSKHLFNLASFLLLTWVLALLIMKSINFAAFSIALPVLIFPIAFSCFLAKVANNLFVSRLNQFPKDTFSKYLIAMMIGCILSACYFLTVNIKANLNILDLYKSFPNENNVFSSAILYISYEALFYFLLVGIPCMVFGLFKCLDRPYSLAAIGVATAPLLGMVFYNGSPSSLSAHVLLMSYLVNVLVLLFALNLSNRLRPLLNKVIDMDKLSYI